MNTTKILCGCFCVLFLTACASDVYTPDTFKKYTAKQILIGGEKKIAKGDYKESTRYFEAIDALYPFAPEAQQGQLDAIYAYYKAEDYASAVAAIDRYIQMYPVSKNTDYAFYMKGVINFEKDRTWLQKIYTKHTQKYDLENLREAFAALSELVRRFPNSVYVKDATKRMLHIRNLLASRELETAKFYFDREAYIAAVNRATDVVQNFAGSPQMLEALKIMIKSYQALGADKQANDAMRVLKLNFPKERV